MARAETEKYRNLALLGGEDSYASATAQNPATSRRVKSLIPTQAGFLERERPNPLFKPGNLGALPVGFLFQFDRANTDGTFTTYFFGATKTALYESVGADWFVVNAVGALATYPQAYVTNNMMHLSDGVTNWMFDGTNWFIEGFPIPPFAPAPVVVSGSGPLNIIKNRYYWFTWADKEVTPFAERNHESSSSPRSVGTGAVLNGKVRVYPFQGLLSVSNGSTKIVGVGNGSVTTATGKLAIFANFADGNIVTVSTGIDYTFRNALSGAPNEVLIDSNPQVSLANLQAAVNGDAGAGVAYGIGTIKNPYASIAEVNTFTDPASPTGVIYTATFFALTPGIPGNSVATVATVSGGGGFNDTTLTGGTTGEPGASFDPSFKGMKLYVNGTDLGVIADAGLVSATGKLVTFVNLSDGDTVLVDTQTYTARLGVAVAYDFKIGATALETFGNLRAAVNRWAGEGTIYGVGTLAHPTVRVQTVELESNLAAPDKTQTAATWFAVSQGVSGNSIATVATFVAGQGFAAATLTGGHDGALAVASSIDAVGANYTVAPVRATNIHIYASESEESNVGLLLASIAASQPFFDDLSPFANDPTSSFSSTQRPIRNDPPPASRILTLHELANRAFRVRVDKPKFYAFSAQEEVLATGNGSPEESYPGAAANTVSDLVNGGEFPGPGRSIRSLVSHGDALYMGTEKEVGPLYGKTFDDFGFSSITVFRVGAAGRFGNKSTPWGLAWVSYDRRVLLFPASYTATVDGTSNLIHLSRPLQRKLNALDPTDLDNIHLEYYLWNKRDWLVLSFKDAGTNGARHTWVYDFLIRGWFELQRGVQALAVLEPTPGNRVLVGGGTDGFVYVLDDIAGVYDVSTTKFPVGTFRPALIDFGNPEMAHIPFKLEFEVSDPKLADDITLSYWLDPVDVDNPPSNKKVPLPFARVDHSAYRFRAFFKGGRLCYRLLLEVSVASSLTDANIFNLMLTAEPVLSVGIK